jgi:hypothetical protein
MSEKNPGGNAEHESMSPVRRYYSDLYYLQAPGHARDAVQNLYEYLPCIPTLPVAAVLDSGLMPYDFEYDTDLRIAKEKLALLPLIAFSDDIDDSLCSTGGAEAWYHDVVSHIRMLVDDNHGVSCLEYDEANPRHKMCGISSVCPWRFLKTFLGDSALNNDFSDPLYRHRPDRARRLVLAKLNIGQAHGILTPIDAEQTAESYTASLRQYLRGTTGESHGI